MRPRPLRPQLKRDPLDSTVASVHFLVFDVRPKPSRANYAQLGGATAIVLVDQTSQAAAEALACELIDRQQWIVSRLRDAHPVDPDSLETVDLQQAFQQAKTDGLAAIFQTWPRRLPHLAGGH